MMELLKIGSASMQRRLQKLAKRRKRRRDEMAEAVAAMRRKGR